MAARRAEVQCWDETSRYIIQKIVAVGLLLFQVEKRLKKRPRALKKFTKGNERVKRET
jgi:hypothetical protein